MSSDTEANGNGDHTLPMGSSKENTVDITQDGVEHPASGEPEAQDSLSEEDAEEASSDAGTDDEEFASESEGSDDDEEEEPTLKYERLGGFIPDMTKKDSISAICTTTNSLFVRLS